MNLTRLQCCGLIELGGLSSYEDDPKRALQDSLWNSKGEPWRLVGTGIWLQCGWVLFSESRQGTYGSEFADWLEKEELGRVVRLPEVINKNSANPIRVYLWQVNHDNLMKWMEANKPEVKQSPQGNPTAWDNRTGQVYVPPAPPPAQNPFGTVDLRQFAEQLRTVQVGETFTIEGDTTITVTSVP